MMFSEQYHLHLLASTDGPLNIRRLCVAAARILLRFVSIGNIGSSVEGVHYVVERDNLSS